MELDDRLYQSWLFALQTWAAERDLLRAGTDALQLSRGWNTQRLQRIADRLVQGDERDIPPIELLPGSAMPGAAGAYAKSTGTIYLNQTWVQTASQADIIKVLNEEYGHHLDALFNQKDTKGDEGEIFSDLLIGNTSNQIVTYGPESKQYSDHGEIKIRDEVIQVEYASTNLDGSIQLDGSEGRYQGSRSADTIYGSPLDDSIWPANGHDWVNAGDGNDTVEGGNQKDTIYGGDGNDFIHGRGHNDLIYGGEGNDTIHGGNHTDIVYGEGGNDRLFSERNNDTLYGGEGNDYLDGKYGDCLLVGGPGDDTIWGGKGTDTAVFTGNRNNYTIQYSKPEVQLSRNDIINKITIIGIDGTDKITGRVNILRFDDIDVTEAIAPRLQSAATSIDGSKVILSYDEALSSNTADTSNFDVSSDGKANAVTSVAISGSTVELALTKTITNDQAVTVAYTDTSSNDDSDVIQDSQGNDAASLSSTAVTNNSTVKRTPPTVALKSDVSSLKAGETATLTFTLSVPSSDFTASDITVSGGTLSNFAGSGTSYSAIFTPKGNSTRDAVISVASGVFSDSAGNTNQDGSDSNNSLVLSVDTARKDTTPPNIAISSNLASLGKGDTPTITFSLSEPSNNFNQSDISVSGGSLSNFSGSGSSYTAIFTPEPNSTTNGVISVGSGAFSDSAGNTNQDGSDRDNSLNLSIDTTTADTTPPTIAITDDDADNALSADDSTTITFTLSEASTDFIASDITISGGKLSNFSGSGTSYTATFTPNRNSNEDGIVSVASGVFSDLAGNTNQDGSDPNNSITLFVDTYRPSITITDADAGQSRRMGESTTVLFSLSEDCQGFSASSVSVSGGTLSNFTGAGRSYSALFTPDGNSDGLIFVPYGSFCDLAGNSNLDEDDGKNELSLPLDTVKPTIALTSDLNTLSAGDTATLTFNLSETSTDFDATDVSVSGGLLSQWISISPREYTATFTPTSNSTTDGVISVASGSFSDPAGNSNADGNDTDNTLRLTINTTPSSRSPKATPKQTPRVRLEQIQSIDDITNADETTTFELIRTIKGNDQELNTLIAGTAKKDVITGTSEGEIIAGMQGKDKIKGGGGGDAFLLQDSQGFGKKRRDTIKDFNPEEGDCLLIEEDVFDVGKKLKLKTVKGAKAAKRAADSRADFIYDRRKGLLFYNENGKEDGWGDGGLFLKLKGAPELGESDFAII